MPIPLICESCKKELVHLKEDDFGEPIDVDGTCWEQYLCDICHAKIWKALLENACGECRTRPCEHGRDCWVNPFPRIMYLCYVAPRLPKISTTITKKFFEMKMEDLKKSGHFIEFKECKPFWDKRLAGYASNHDDLDVEIVFLVGSVPHRFKAISIWQVHRDFVYRRYEEAIKTEFAYAIKCIEAALSASESEEEGKEVGQEH